MRRAGLSVRCRTPGRGGAYSVNSQSTDLPAFAGFLTAPLSRWCRSARPALPSVALRPDPLTAEMLEAFGWRQFSEVQVPQPPKGE